MHSPNAVINTYDWVHTSIQQTFDRWVNAARPLDGIRLKVQSGGVDDRSGHCQITHRWTFPTITQHIGHLEGDIVSTSQRWNSCPGADCPVHDRNLPYVDGFFSKSNKKASDGRCRYVVLCCFLPNDIQQCC